jgi:hypothetical protein
MDEPRAQRTLVKSPPELWAEISDAGALAGHLGAFGEIRITRLEPETTVAWEGDRARGTVELEPAGWGTKVTLTAQLAPEPAPGGQAPPPQPDGGELDAVEAVEPSSAGTDAAAPAADEPVPALAPRRRGFLWRLLGRQRHEPPPPAPDEPQTSPQRTAGAGPPAAPAASASVVEPAGPASVDPAPLEAGRAEAVLVGVLDDLGAARHRPFSRG